jgi:hypothetical protein
LPNNPPPSRALGLPVRRPRSSHRRLVAAAPLVAALALAGCSGSGGGSVLAPGATTTQPQLQRIEYGRLVDVYGLQVTPEGSTTTLYRRDVLIGGNIRDQRPANSTLSDAEVTYDFIAADPDTLQPRLFIPRDITQKAFADAFEALDDQLRVVSPMLFGQGGAGMPFSVVPRNAAIRLSFSAPLGVGDDFFVERDPTGRVVGLRNTEAVQVLRIVGDPNQPNGFVPLPVRVIASDRTLVIDPVLLGTEGLQYQTTNNAAGLPASPDQLGANIRIAVALEGPLAIPGLRESDSTGLTGFNNAMRKSIVRDFRSGNANDTSADIARGFVRDELPLRILGEIVMYLESVEPVNAFTQEVTIYKGGVSHEIDLGDVFRFVHDASGVPFGAAEVVVDPDDDRDQPSNQHVRVRIRRVPGLETIDPRNLPGYPSLLSQREPWLKQNAPRAVCVAEYTAGDQTGRDDPRNFLRFTPGPLQIGATAPEPNEHVSPFAGAVVRFTKPVDIETVKWADTFFFAMRDLTTTASIEDFINNRPNAAGGLGMRPEAFNMAKYRTPYLITARVFDEDGSQTALRLQPTTGFYLDNTMRNPPAGADYRYFLHLISDSTDGGVRDLAGNRVDLQGTTPDRNNSVVIPFTVDTRMVGNTPVFPDNIAISVVRRFASRDEDANPSYFLPSEVQSPTTGSLAAAYPLEDMFGAFLYLDNKLQARPTTRVRVVADNLNQNPIVQQTPPGQLPNPLAWCPQYAPGHSPGDPQVGSNSATNLVQAGIQNPLNPYGARLQTVWREVDLSLSRTDPFDFNLDIEQMYWAPYTQTNLSFDEFDRTSLWLGHSEYRPAPCTGAFSAQPGMGASGLRTTFERNFLWNPSPANPQTVQSQAPRRAAYVDRPMTIDPATVVYEANGVNRFLPLPTFQKPYFTFRDETVMEQGGDAGQGSDQNDAIFPPYILSPFAMGQGRRWVDGGTGAPGNVQFVNGVGRIVHGWPRRQHRAAAAGGLLDLLRLAGTAGGCRLHRARHERLADGGDAAVEPDAGVPRRDGGSRRDADRPGALPRPGRPGLERGRGWLCDRPAADADAADGQHVLLDHDGRAEAAVRDHGRLHRHVQPAPRARGLRGSAPWPVLPDGRHAEPAGERAADVRVRVRSAAEQAAVGHVVRAAVPRGERGGRHAVVLERVDEQSDRELPGEHLQHQRAPAAAAAVGGELPARPVQGRRRALAQVGHAADAGHEHGAELVDLPLQPHRDGLRRRPEHADVRGVRGAVRGPERGLHAAPRALRQLAVRRRQQRRRLAPGVAEHRHLRPVLPVPAAVGAAMFFPPRRYRLSGVRREVGPSLAVRSMPGRSPSVSLPLARCHGRESVRRQPRQRSCLT